jgi:hypothetical protein
MPDAGNTSNLWARSWTYRSLVNDLDLSQDFGELGRGPVPVGRVASFYAAKAN